MGLYADRKRIGGTGSCLNSCTWRSADGIYPARTGEPGGAQPAAVCVIADNIPARTGEPREAMDGCGTDGSVYPRAYVGIPDLISHERSRWSSARSIPDDVTGEQVTGPPTTIGGSFGLSVRAVHGGTAVRRKSALRPLRASDPRAYGGFRWWERPRTWAAQVYPRAYGGTTDIEAIRGGAVAKWVYPRAYGGTCHCAAPGP